MEALLRPVRGALWYLREISGDNAYEKYLAAHEHTHPDRQPMERGEFYRARQEEKYLTPGSRCP